MELVCPAGNLPALKEAVRAGANAVYAGFRDETNARHFNGLNFTPQKLAEGVRFAHQHGSKLFLAINTYPQPDGWRRWQEAVDRAAGLGVDALIAADIGVLDYAAERWPQLPLHLSVQGSATNHESISLFYQQFGIRRVVVPRVLSLAQIRQLVASSPVEIEVFGFGSLCVMVEGRCLLSSFATGKSPNTYGACSPASAVEWRDCGESLETRLGDVLIERYSKGENAGYPTLCKGRFQVGDNLYHALEEPTSLNTIDLLPELMEAGVTAIKLEGRQRSPAYIAQVARIWRAAIDACSSNPQQFRPDPEWLATLTRVSEGTTTTLGAYHRPWQ